MYVYLVSSVMINMLCLYINIIFSFLAIYSQSRSSVSSPKSANAVEMGFVIYFSVITLTECMFNNQ